MADETPASGAPQKSGGLKMVLILIIVILAVGMIGAWIMLKPTPPPELKTYVFPGEEEEALKLTVTLSDGSYHLVADIRLETAPVDLLTHGKEIEAEFKERKSMIMGVMTEVANSLDQTSVHKLKEYKTRLLHELNEKLKTCEIEEISVENWLVQPAE